MTHEEAVSTMATERYLLDEMATSERDDFEDHYFSCVVCADDVREAAMMQDGVRAGLLGRATERELPERFAAPAGRVVAMRPRKAWYQSAVLPWAVAATLAVVAGYQSLIFVPGAQRGAGPRSLTAVTLRPASRGAEQQVSLARDVVFALDVSSAANVSELTYDLRTAAGTGVISDRVQAPAPGAPLLLLIPAGALREPGHYMLSVAGTEYRFEAVR